MSDELIHPEHYSLNESARRAVLLARGARRVLKGKSTAQVDRALERLADEARAREAKQKREAGR
jgi:hypothetical protein